MSNDNKKPPITFVTSIHEGGFLEYGQKMLEAVVDKWHPDSKFICYYHDFDIHSHNPPQSPIIEYRYLNEVEDMVEYKERFGKYNGNTSNGYSWRMDAIKWCHKVFAMTELAFEMAEETVDAGWMIWIDADTLTHSKFDPENLRPFLSDKVSIVHLGRTDIDYSETSFLAFNLNRENPLRLLGDLRGAYVSGEVLGYREWHDGFVFERLLNIYKAHGTNVHNLTPVVKGLDAFNISPLADWFHHYKGNKKSMVAKDSVSPDVNGPARYKQLLDIVGHYKAFRIVETGSWNGGRAIQMAEKAFEHSPIVKYWGFDLFEEATEELDRIEMNGKPHNSIEAVTKRLEDYKDKKAKEGKTFIFELKKGDTKKTLEFSKAITADIAYLDGGHSYETVYTDYKAFDHIPVVVFDDFFSKDKNNYMPPEEHCGTNRVFKEIAKDAKEMEAPYRFHVLPSQDLVRDGGHTHLAVVIHDKKLPDLPKPLTQIPIIVNPKDCMPSDYIKNNVRTNLAKVGNDNWIKACAIHDTRLLIVSGGRIDFKELKQTIRQLKKDRKDFRIACVKHSYPKLLENGISPDYCVVLDPRPIDGVSTHGVVRKDLFEKIDKKTKFLVASMTDPSVVDYLLKKKATIKMWHAYSEALRDQSIKDKHVIDKTLGMSEGSIFITGGTAAALRTYGMFHVMGFRFFHLFGFDCSFPEEYITDERKAEKIDEEKDQPKYMKVGLDDKGYWTTGELLAFAQDCEKLFKGEAKDSYIWFHGEDTLCSELFRTSEKAKEHNWKEIINA